jgi:endoglucanase
MATIIYAAALSITPAEFVQSMGMGINLGNTLDAPEEGQWAAPAEERYFDLYKAAGFKSVRIPCQWSQHASTEPPFMTVHNKFLTRVAEVVSWSTARALPTIVNTHHDDWLDGSADTADFEQNLERLVAIWKAIGEKFASVPDELLAFEIYNEPHYNMTTEWLNKMNAAVLPVIRATNPTRIVFLGGLKFMNPRWEVQNPDAIEMLPKPTPADPYLALEVHSYDPFPFCGGGATGPSAHQWSPSQTAPFDALKSWADGRNVSILLGEFGCTKMQSNSSGRVAWYAHMRDMVEAHGFAADVWDDSGHFALLDRGAGTWDTDVLSALGLKPSVQATATTARVAGDVADIQLRLEQASRVPDPSWRPMSEAHAMVGGRRGRALEHEQ